MSISDRWTRKRSTKLVDQGIAAVHQGDYQTARSKAETLINLGVPYGYTILGVLYTHGAGIEKDYLKAERFFKNALSMGEPEAAYHYGLLIFEHKIPGSLQQAFSLFETAAKSDVEFAFYYLGLCYFEGKGCNKNEYEASWWMAKAEEVNDENSKFYMALFRMFGIGFEKNESNFQTGLQDMMALGMLGDERAVNTLQQSVPDRDWRAFFSLYR